MDDRELHLLINGGLNRPIAVGRLEQRLASRLGSATDLVHLHPKYAQKIRFKHGFGFGHFQQIPFTLKYGRVAQDRDRALLFLYHDDIVYGRSFLVAVKVTGERHELLISTAHKLRRQEAKRIWRKYPAIREHHED